MIIYQNVLQHREFRPWFFFHADTPSDTDQVLATASIAGLAAAAPFPSEDVAAVSRALKAYISHGPNYQPNRTAPAGARILEAGETVTSSVAVTSINDNDGIGGGTDSYTMYWGDGSAADGWPTIDQWYV